MNASLQQGRIPAYLKEAAIRLLLKKLFLDPTFLDNYQPVSTIQYLGKLLERLVAYQFQGFLGGTDFLDPFQSGLRPGYRMETALVARVDGLHQLYSFLEGRT